MLRGLLTLSIYGLVFLGVVFWSYIAYRLGRYPENHVGWNVLWSLGLFGALALLTLVHWNWNGSYLSIWFLGFAALSCVLVLSLYYFNILVPYEVWLQRGMPERPF
ncbi:MAG: hypothetical protein IAF00_11210 [Phycisphaerales bacterium]|nr:hypothetical protein [Phycisphaerales bacterium]